MSPPLIVLVIFLVSCVLTFGIARMFRTRVDYEWSNVTVRVPSYDTLDILDDLGSEVDREVFR